MRLLAHYLERYDGDRDRVLAAYYQGQWATDHHGIRRGGVSPREAFEALADRGERELAVQVLAWAPAQVVRDDLIERNGEPVRSPGAAESSRSP